MSNTVCVTIPHPLRERAGMLRINISQICREALADEIANIEKETGVVSGKTSPGSRPDNGGQINVAV